MSGSKVTYVTMDQREAQRLRQMDTHFSAVQRDLPQRLRQIENGMRGELDSQRRRAEQRWKEFERVSRDLRGELAAAEQRNQERLRKGLDRLRAEYTESLSQEREERGRQAEHMRREYHTLVDEERAARQQQVSELSGRIGRMEHQEATLHQMAEAWLQDLRTLRQEVDKLPHQRFAPGRMARLSAMIEQGESNLRSGASQAAMVNAQNCYLDLVELRADVLYQEQLFEQAYLQATQAVKALLEEINAHRIGTAFADTPQAFDFEVDFWSEGKLSSAAGSLKALELKLENEKETLTLKQVQALEEESVRLRGEMLAAVEQAKVAIINGQACYNVSQVVERVLQGQGFSVDDGVYEGKDQRGAYALKMTNRSGDEVVTIVTPSKEEELAYKLEMNFFDQSRDEALRRSFAGAVYEGLQGAGLKATPPTSVRGVDEPNEEVRNLERFSRRGEVQVTQFQPASIRSR
jgi:hypothetical protein